MTICSLVQCCRNCRPSAACFNISSIVATVAIVLVNKRILNYFEGEFSGGVLLLLHSFVTVLTTRCHRVSAKIPPAWLLFDALLSFVSVLSSFIVLKFSTVSFQQIGRLLTIPVSLLVDKYFWGSLQVDADGLVSIFGIMFGFRWVSKGTEVVSKLLIFGNLVSVCAQVASQTSVRFLFRKFEVNAADHLAQTAPYSLACSSLTTLITHATTPGVRRALTALRWQKDIPSDVVSCVALSCALALSVQLLSTKLSQASSALSYSLLTITKSVCTIGLGAYLFSEHWSHHTLLGVVLCIIMFFRYLRSVERVQAAQMLPISTESLRRDEFRPLFGSITLLAFAAIERAIALP